MRGKAHDPETKAAVMAALLAGQGVNEVARRYSLAPAVVSRWRAEIPTPQLEQVGIQKTRDFGEMLGDYLEANLRALKAQAEVAADPSYIRSQPASELATLHGVMADKGIRLLEAAQASSEGEEPEDDAMGAAS